MLIPCGGKKKAQPDAGAIAASLPYAGQAVLEKAWLAKVGQLPLESEAGSLYGGRGFALGREVALRFGARLFVISAGLGLLEADRKVPLYGMTVSGRGPESIVARADGPFDPSRWWEAVSGSAYSAELGACLAGPGRGRVLIALTRPYACMFGPALARAVVGIEDRVRIFGRGLTGVLPAGLLPLVMPYDDGLDAIIPGTRADFSQRALSHFANEISPAGSGLPQDLRAVAFAMSVVTAPARPKRPRASDEEVVARIRAHLPAAGGIGETLHRLRKVDFVACEQKRFTRLYHFARASEGLA